MLTLYTDGSCLNNPGAGGWAFLALDAQLQKICSHSGYCAQTTNNQMELQAVIEGLTWALAHNYKAAIIVTDSKYVEQGMTQWLNQWKKNHWRTSNKGAVKNQDYWQRLDSLSQNLIVDWQWVKAHHTDSHNAYVDKLARQAAMRLPGENSCL